MNIFKIINENGNEYVMINIIDYNKYMLRVAISNKKLINESKIDKRQEKQQIHDAVEKRKIEAIKAKERREIEMIEMKSRKVEREIEINRIKKERDEREQEQFLEQLKEEYKDYFESNPTATAKKCYFCKFYRVFPHHFLNENKKPYMIECRKNKKYDLEVSCVDCYDKEEEKKEDRKKRNVEWCKICNKDIYIKSDLNEIDHYSLLYHKRREAKLIGSNDLKLLSRIDLNKICSKSVDENGVCLISNYTRFKKNELIEKMNAIYDKLVF